MVITIRTLRVNVGPCVRTTYTSGKKVCDGQASHVVRRETKEKK